LPGFFGFVAAFAFSSAKGAIAFLADDVREVLDFARGLFAAAFAAGLASAFWRLSLSRGFWRRLFFVDLFRWFS